MIPLPTTRFITPAAFLLASLFLYSLAHGDPPTERTWTDTEGRGFRGSLVSADADWATIRRASDQRTFQVSLNTLSQADREYIAAWVAEKPMEQVVNEPPPETYPASGELVIEIPHGHKLDRWQGCEAFLVEEELDEPEKETVFASTKPKVKWDAGEHGMVGTIEFKDVPLLKDAKAVVRFRFTGVWDGEPYDQIAYSRSVRLDRLRDGELDLRKVEVDFRRP